MEGFRTGSGMGVGHEVTITDMVNYFRGLLIELRAKHEGHEALGCQVVKRVDQITSFIDQGMINDELGLALALNVVGLRMQDLLTYVVMEIIKKEFLTGEGDMSKFEGMVAAGIIHVRETNMEEFMAEIVGGRNNQYNNIFRSGPFGPPFQA